MPIIRILTNLYAKQRRPRQGGRAGFSAADDTFTVPLMDADFQLLASDPLKAKSTVVNKVELGEGSRRIHAAKGQEWLVALLSKTGLVRDVIASPKSMNDEDLIARV
ncbi:hypothetical protein QBC33DRAFT_519565 [Phialemonium atrogriseum]|uniref:Uncharacterized protein n=1 Tax=Phialemonium atrogriseum TaxID=1093897 RepID=A0AAJ0FGL5_9PEZI|nr:uncharacterized protein QBC33DRAFT_519565 [Phialemonium atrogriseum]KAK1762478.1 hypothetical protein QBC33DRAFT_519565 [Phialemonium atrogriseum]